MENYDKKLDEMKEAIEMKEVERMQLQDQLGPQEFLEMSIKTRDSFDNKISFLKKMISKLLKARRKRSISRSLASSRQAACG